MFNPFISHLKNRLNKIFGVGISINSIRHEYLTDKYKDIPLLKEMEKTAYDMGKTNNIEGLLTYIKN